MTALTRSRVSLSLTMALAIHDAMGLSQAPSRTDGTGRQKLIHSRQATWAFGLPMQFAKHTSPLRMIPSSDVGSDVSAEIMPAETEGQSSVQPLFDVSDYVMEDESNDIPLAALFEDVESDYGAVPKQEGGDDAKLLEYENESNALTDDEDRILTDREDRLFQFINNTQKVESCILVGVEDLSRARKERKLSRQNEDMDIGLTWTLEEALVEMRELIKTSGLSLRGEITQRLQEVNPRTYIGTGKVKEAQTLLEEINEELERGGEGRCCTVVFDAELTPGQQKALENSFNTKVIENDFLGSDQDGVVKVVDRTALILDIFAQHAKTREGKLQVDLALHEYRKPRLTRMWTHLERQSGAGGVGLRGPGETQLEVDKRILRDRILVLKGKIDDVQKQRDLHRRGRKRGGLPVLALVGYTNAGKSTLLNCLTKVTQSLCARNSLTILFSQLTNEFA